MNGWEVRTVDPHDDVQLRAWWEAAHAAQADRPYDFFSSWEATRLTMPAPDPNWDKALLGVYDDGVMVGAADLSFPLSDNRHLAFTKLWVRPESRRRGIGTALVRASEEEARSRGRDVVLASAASPPGEECPGTHLGDRLGYARANLEEHKVLDLAAAEPAWPELEAEAHAALGDYRIEVWERIPDEYVEGYCRLVSVFFSKVPLGDMALENMRWTPERIRINEARAEATGRKALVAAAISPDGSVAGSSDVNLNTVDPRIAWVGITLVLGEHRGHRLGLALKLANHRALRAAFPGCELVATENATVNEHMTAINARMGYRVVEQIHELQRRL